MRPLGLTLALASGRTRIVLVIVPTALASGLLLVAVSITRLWAVDRRPDLQAYDRDVELIGAIADPGTRPGAVLGVVLLTVPLLLLLDQAVRLGSSSRHRRYDALRVAGATGRDLRRWGALEVALPAFLGALLGVPVWLLLRVLLGGRLVEAGALVPPDVGPGWWTVLAVAAVTTYGALVGLRQGSRSTGAVTGEQRAPRPWWLLPLVLLGGLWWRRDLFDSDAGGFAVVVLLTLLLALLAPTAAYLVARVLVRRAGSVPVLLAGRRLVADPGPAGRAAAAVGAVGLTLGVVPVFLGTLGSQGVGGDRDYYVVPAVAAGLCALVALLVIAASLAVHSTETVLERRREMATLVATGVPARTISASQRFECLVVTVPLALLGALLGSFGYAYLGAELRESTTEIVLAVAVTAAVSVAACWLATSALQPWVRDAVDPEHLRTA